MVRSPLSWRLFSSNAGPQRAPHCSSCRATCRHSASAAATAAAAAANSGTSSSSSRIDCMCGLDLSRLCECLTAAVSWDGTSNTSKGYTWQQQQRLLFKPGCGTASFFARHVQSTAVTLTAVQPTVSISLVVVLAAMTGSEVQAAPPALCVCRYDVPRALPGTGAWRLSGWHSNIGVCIFVSDAQAGDLLFAFSVCVQHVFLF